MITDTPWSVIDRVARHVGVLAYDDENEALVLAPLSEDRAATDLVMGMNVEAATL